MLAHDPLPRSPPRAAALRALGGLRPELSQGPREALRLRGVRRVEVMAALVELHFDVRERGAEPLGHALPCGVAEGAHGHVDRLAEVAEAPEVEVVGLERAMQCPQSSGLLEHPGRWRTFWAGRRLYAGTKDHPEERPHALGGRLGHSLVAFRPEGLLLGGTEPISDEGRFHQGEAGDVLRVLGGEGQGRGGARREPDEVDALLAGLLGDAPYPLDLRVEGVVGGWGVPGEDLQLLELRPDLLRDLTEERAVDNPGGGHAGDEHHERASATKVAVSPIARCHSLPSFVGVDHDGYFPGAHATQASYLPDQARTYF